MGLSRSDALSIGRGVGAEAVQAVVLISDTTPIEIIAGRTGQTLYLNYLAISMTDAPEAAYQSASLTDGSGGTVWWAIELGASANYQPRSYALDFGEYGFALTQDNGLYGVTSGSTFDIAVTALGCWR